LFSIGDSDNSAKGNREQPLGRVPCVARPSRTEVKLFEEGGDYPVGSGAAEAAGGDAPGGE